MRHLRQALIVASWEFTRYFKWKDQLVGLAFFIVVSGLLYGASIVAGAGRDTVTVALSGLDLQAPSGSRFRFVRADPDEAMRIEALRSGTIDAVLSRQADARFEILVEKDPRYGAELQTLLTDVIRQDRAADTGLSPEGLARLLAPATLDIQFIDPGRARRGRAERVAAVVVIVVMLLAVFTSLAYILTGITGEKQLRVTEAIVSAISPQAWIDGKILGIAAYSVAALGNVVVGGMMVAGVARVAWGFTLPWAAARPAVLLALLVFAVLGLLLWNAFFAAVASTIDDPNTSARTSLILLPVVPVVLSLAILRDPESTVSRTLAICPLTSAPALPMRLVLSDPGLVEVVLAALFLVATIWVTRRLAGRVFEVGMLLYGKEPTLREIWRWARERGTVRNGPAAVSPSRHQT